jgi:hypothetical protein
VSRIILIMAAVIVVIGIAATFWVVRDPSGTPHPTGPGEAAPQQLDMTGGQKMQLRWNQEEGLGDDATNE